MWFFVIFFPTLTKTKERRERSGRTTFTRALGARNHFLSHVVCDLPRQHFLPNTGDVLCFSVGKKEMPRLRASCRG